jgi:peptidoglycan/xylan/chitin deacetylase (PgdA/CDA1 family)
VDRLAAPAGRSPAHLADPDGVQRRVDGRHGRAISLTFDDGPDPRWTPAVLDLLRQYRARATFCVVGEHVAAHPELVRRIAEEGHALCDHTWSHDEALGRRNPATIHAELARTYDAIVAASGVPPRYFRAPAGRWSAAVLAEARRLGLRPLGWSADPRDWTRPAAPEIVRRVLDGAGAGSIVLLHDGYGQLGHTAAALADILPALTARHLAFAIP